jgi:predicted phage terminase large subunit-like protein
MTEPEANSQQEEVRLLLRERCLSSLYFFAKLIFGYKDLDPDFHGEVCHYLSQPAKRKLLVLPRGHLKSSISTIAYSAWRATRDPNIRILIANATSSNAENFLNSIGATIKQSTLYHWLFPECTPDFGSVRWNSHALEFRRSMSWPEATIECIGVGGTAVSRHYDIIIKDDLVNEDHIATSEQMAKVVEWHKYAESLFINPGEGEDLVVGTRWAFNDIISYVLEHGDDYTKMVRSVIQDGRPLWPQRFTEETINKIKYRQGPKIFSCQYMNDPIHDDAKAFDKDWFRWFLETPRVKLSIYTACDPAISTGRGDFSGLVTVGIDPDYNIYVLEAKHGRWGVDELVEQIFQTYFTWKPDKFGIETVMFQKALLWPIREGMRRHGTHFFIEQLKPSTRITKEARIASLHPYFANGSIWMKKDQEVLIRELSEFPVGSNDDVVDALAYAVQMAQAPSRGERTHTNPFQLEEIMRELRQKQTNRTGQAIWPAHVH